MNPRFFRRQGVTGAERRGVRGNLRLVLADRRPAENVEPTVERAAALIDAIRYYGEREGDAPAEAMTATAAALYELLMSHARPEIKERTEHMVSFADAKAYLKVEKSSRIRRCMSALSATWVSYDFLDPGYGLRRTGGRVQLMRCGEAVSKDGERFIAFSMHPAVRKAILESRRYTHLELGAFPRFSSKYTSRLYPKLALMAGRELRPPMAWTPAELAEELGWRPAGAFKFSNFESRVLRPVLEDIRQHVRRFAVICEYRRVETRGRPVSSIILTVGSASVAPDEHRKTPMTPKDRGHVRLIASRAAVDLDTQMPGEDALRRAATRVGKSVTEVATMWTDAFADDGIMDLLRAEGLPVAFEAWVRKQEQTAGSDEVSFEDTRIIRLIVAPDYRSAAVEKLLLSYLDTGATWSGTETKTLRVEWTQDGDRPYLDYELAATEDDIARLAHRYADMIDDVEYVA